VALIDMTKTDGEVEPGIFAVQSARQRVICACSIFRRGVASCAIPLAVLAYLREPFTAGLDKRNAFIAGGIGRAKRLVGRLLGIVGWPKIASPVVESGETIYVIGSTSYTHDIVVHGDDPAPTGKRVAYVSNSVETLAAVASCGMPVELGQSRKVLRVNDGGLILSKSDETVRFVKRLDNLVAIHGVLHDSTSNGIVRRFSRISILSGAY
jgi:hypothetical protein